MIIHTTKFIKSSNDIKQCPVPEQPEFGFIGRSNVGKSSLINMLTGIKGLAKTSAEPGKTRLMNHFLINDEWYLVDLPGYGYAKVSAAIREKWIRITREYIGKRENLICLFVLLDPRVKPQKSDLEFMEDLGVNGIPFARVFTKSDKMSAAQLNKSLMLYDEEMLKVWESLPQTFVTSAVSKKGREELLGYIEESINKLSNLT